jgi:hypothetical protein
MKACVGSWAGDGLARVGKEKTMQSTNVRDINAAIWLQTMRGTRNVQTPDGFRVIRAKTVKGNLKAKLLSGKWVSVAYITID